ncbi:MAG: class I SAM-dependent methyltransferase [Acidobacteria bacterium]|nr:class I SAM-dependent methyltransferase [Acidobacteriota bacterium]
MSGADKGRGLPALGSLFGQRPRAGAGQEVGVIDRPAPRAAEPIFPSKALKKFLAVLRQREGPVILDVGAVVGSNITFLGEQGGCKIHVEDLYADLDRHTRKSALEAFPAFLKTRLSHADGSVDGVLCWDLFDYLDPAAATVLAGILTRALRIDGALLGFFGTAASRDPRYVKYAIVDEANLKYRPYPAARGRVRVLQNRDIIKLFGGLRVSDSFLLKTNLREILFRKPGYLA